MPEKDMDGLVIQSAWSQPEEPWAFRHGLYAGIKLQPNGLGWALIEPAAGSRIEAEGRDRIDGQSPEDAALAKWQAAGCPENVTLYKYANDTAYRNSRDKAGMSRKDHSVLVDRVAAKLRRHGAVVIIETVEYL